MTFVETILQKMHPIAKPRRSFLLALFGALSCFVGRATMLNLSRFGAGSPRRIARWFAQPFNWAALNWAALEHAGILENTLAACVDATFLPKSGTKTWGLAHFHNGAAGRSEKGCEALVVGLLDLDERTAYSIDARQTPAECDGAQTRADHYLRVLLEQRDGLLERGVRHVVGDGFFAKVKFTDGLEGAGLHLISKLRSDANLRFLYDGPQGGPGRPRLYDGKVDWDDLSRFEALDSHEGDPNELAWADLNAPHFKRTLRVVVVSWERRGETGRAVLFSTDLKLEPLAIYRLYKARFQQEFVFRDAKQFTGLADGQMRDRVKRGEHINASLSALNLLRLEDRAEPKAPGARVISLASWKRRKHAFYVAERIIEHLDLGPEQRKKLATLEDPAWFGRLAS